MNFTEHAKNQDGGGRIPKFSRHFLFPTKKAWRGKKLTIEINGSILGAKR